MNNRKGRIYMKKIRVIFVLTGLLLTELNYADPTYMAGISINFKGQFGLTAKVIF